MFKRIWITGDTHGNFDTLYWFCESNHTKKDEDLLIILGDAGINYFAPEHPETHGIKQDIEDQDITLLCVRGNHEARPETLDVYRLEDVGIGDPVYVEEDYPSIWFAQDGGEYNICGKSFLTIGGAYSVDKPFRIARGWRWFEDEMLNASERTEILDKVGGKYFDHVLTHTCPFEWQPTHLFLSAFEQDKIPKDMEEFLSAVMWSIGFGHWWFGHFHDNIPDVCGDGKVTMLYHNKMQIV